MAPQIVRSLVFHLDFGRLPREVREMLPEYRLMVNQAIRAALGAGATSRASLNRLVYADLSAQHKGRSGYVGEAIGDAVAIVRAHRKRERHGEGTRPPYVKRLFLKARPGSFHLDSASGNLRLSVGNGSWVMFALPMSEWHRAQLGNANWRPTVLTIKPGKVVLVISKEAISSYDPQSIIAFDTNEDSLDGVIAKGEAAELVRVAFGGLRSVQERHFNRRRTLSRKKTNDWRVKRLVLAREGKRESDRVRSRLHVVSKCVVREATARKATIVLENLAGISRFFSRKLNRRLSSWPHRELHRQIAYKAQAAGVPLVFVDPYLTSQKCAACGWTPKRSKTRKSARRADGMFVCGNPECAWKADRQFNAGVNILRTALTERPGLGGVRFHLDALSHDVMNLLYAPAPRAARGERMEWESQTSAVAGRRPGAPRAARDLRPPSDNGTESPVIAPPCRAP